MNTKRFTMKSQLKRLGRGIQLMLLMVVGLIGAAHAQTPTMAVRFSNPVYVCEDSVYCVDVEFQAAVENLRVFGMNVRLFYDDELLEFDTLTDFEPGYGPAAPIPPAVTMSPVGLGYTWFGFGSPGTGVADFVNGAVQLLDPTQPPIFVSTTGWTKLFRACFRVEGTMVDSVNFCPPLVWDLEQNPANGGWLSGDDGVVITLYVENMPSQPTNEIVDQFNWQYIGNGLPPYGEPIEESCIDLFCVPTITCPPDVTILCSDSTDPNINQVLGTATATIVCESDITIYYDDNLLPIIEGECANEFTIQRRWIVENTCGGADSCTQLITVIDTIPPTGVCPPDVTIECGSSTDPADTGFPTVADNCDSAPLVEYFDITINSEDCPQQYQIDRLWLITDACGNANPICRQLIWIVDTTPPVVTCPADATIECSDPLPTDLATATDNCGGPVDVQITDTYCEHPIIGFVEEYAFPNWTQIIPPQGGDIQQMGDDVMLVSPDGDMPCLGGASVLLQITVQNSGQIVFNWDYTSYDVDGPVVDPFGYSVNGVFFQLTDDEGPAIQTGTAVVNVAAGDIFAFEQQTTDCILGEGASTVVDFFVCEDLGGPVCSTLLIRTHTATDECGNQADCIQTILIEDTTAPVLTCAADVTIECTEDTSPANTGTSTATDNCEEVVIITYSDVTIPSTVCPQELIIQRTWTASDSCGNSSTCLQTITVDDSTPPTFDPACQLVFDFFTAWMTSSSRATTATGPSRFTSRSSTSAATRASISLSAWSASTTTWRRSSPARPT